MISDRDIENRKTMLRGFEYTIEQLRAHVDEHLATATAFKVANHDAAEGFEIYIRARQELIAEYEAQNGIIQEQL